MEDHETSGRKVCARRPKEGLKREQFWANEGTTRTLEELRRAYAEMTGRDVSNSLLVRRALDALKIRVRGAGPDEMDAEAAALLRQAG